MIAHGRAIGAVLFALVWLTAQPTISLAQQQNSRTPGRTPGAFPADPFSSAAMRSAARLNGICFVDPQRGWVVGDRGTIWHTDDGGRHWHLQRSAVSCRLESVCFLDATTGWAAGGFSHPYVHNGSGLILTTRDGGQHWARIPGLILPALKQIGFFDAGHGWAIGCPSSVFPSGGLVTQSGGRNWSPLSGARTPGWTAGDFLDLHNGALAGRNGMAAVVRRGGIEPARSLGFGLRSVKRLTLVPPVYGWLIGDGGLVMMTGDLGTSWQTPPGELPEGSSGHFDFAALAVRGPRCWIAGSPGTRVFHSPDAGRTWTASPTGQSLPIYNLMFVDDQHGWAVGALGNVLATGDGGRTWTRQRTGGTRAALLGIFGRTDDVPLELFARLSGNDGYLGVVEVLGRRDIELPPGRQTHPLDRLHEALVGVGGSDANIAWRFPLRQTGLGLGERQIVSGWDRANDGRGLAELHAHIVRQIRLWRPEVIVTNHAGTQAEDPTGNLVYRAVLQAVDHAADPTSHVGQITQAGLEPWQVKKVYALLPRGEHGSTNITTAQLAGRLGCCLADAASMPRTLIHDRFIAAAETLGFRLVVNHLPEERGRGDFFSGIVLHPGGEARRQLLEPPPGSLTRMQHLAERRRNARAILERSDQEPQGGVQLLAQLGELVGDLDAQSAGRILFHLATKYEQTGRWAMAADTHALLADRYPRHPLAPPALLWLVQYYASEEAAWRVQGKQRFAVNQTSTLSIDMSQQENRDDRAAAIARQIEQTRPELSADPAIGFPLAVVNRRRGFPRQAERFFLARSRAATHDAWWACARGEAWLAEPKGLPPKPLVHCVKAGRKPVLDGKLDDEVWHRAKPVPLQSTQRDDALWPARVMLAYDDQLLYLAVNCRCGPGAKYEPSSGPRPRDPDLSAHDRVDFFFDLDRDHVTYYRLSLDHRGWTGEGCWGDRTWNPTWFVAAKAGDGAWSAEAAIPMDQLTGRYPTSRDVWAVGIQRIVPGVGFQSWSTPAATAVRPEGFGYLIFD